MSQSHYTSLPLDRSKKEIRLLKLVREGGLPDRIRSLAFESGVADSSGLRDLDNESENWLTFGRRVDEDFDVERNDNFLDLERPIQCEMIKASLESPPKYLALSYVWGPYTKSRRIHIRIAKPQQEPSQGVTHDSEEFVVDITDNLHLALAHFMKLNANDTVLLWVDAVCINQNDEKEKSWQVQMMREIYKKASEVHAWLGPTLEGGNGYVRLNRLFGTLESLATEGLKRFGWRLCTYPLQHATSFPGGRRFLDEDLVEWIESRIVFVYPKPEAEAVYKVPNKSKGQGNAYEIWEEELDVLKQLLRMPFWNRVWILQEMVLAESVVFHCGFCSIISADLHAGLKLVTKASHLAGIDIMAYSSEFNSEPPISKSKDPRQWNVGFLDVNEPNFCPMLDRRYPDQPVWERKVRLSDILIWNYDYGHLRASLDKDYIYGFLGMVNDHGSNELVPDYTKSSRDIYAEAGIKCIQEIGLKALSYCQNTTRLPNTPSWVPDFSIPDTRVVTVWDMHPDLTRMGLFDSGTSSNFRFLTTPSGSMLASTGVELATIQKPFFTIPPWNGRVPLLRRIWDIQGRFLVMKNLVEDAATAYKTKQDRLMAFAGTLAAGGNDRGRLLDPEDSGSLDQIYRGFKALIDPSSVPVSYSGICNQQLVSEFFRDAAYCACVQTNIWCDEKYRASTPTPAQRAQMEHPSEFFGPLFFDFAEMIVTPRDDRHREMFEDIASFLDMVQARTKGRRVFLCEDGYLVLAPKLSIAGDIIVQFDGYRVPFVLRPGSNDSFYLIGEAYVYGVMDPELSERQQQLGFKISQEVEGTINCRGKDVRREFMIQ
ncbi:heterokaryon incompatibility protein-domain-containing protein [Camillea tinctor]|nr:heterokaryon incompatibility protein-domain-containing protein [Camillea tinctor]